MNLLYYDGLDLKREQLALPDVGPRSFSWVDTQTSMSQWLESDSQHSPFFWISGKPGSGKSTLMKHLSESRPVLNRLCSRGEQWTVVYFFFDYRAGVTTANRPLGMLKIFLRQLIVMKEVKERLQHVPQVDLAEDNVDKHLELLAGILRDLQLNVCAFIDGLDEYEGDLWDLCILLETLQHRTGMKLCVVSRPEAAFEQSFAPYPNIIMQEHNSVSISLYARQKINKFRALHPLVDDDLFSNELLDALSEKAQGIILWARLVVDEMIKCCTQSTVTQDLFALLQSLPYQLEELYERILNNTNATYRRETATMLHILVENDSSLKAATLFQAWDYIKQVILQDSITKNTIEFHVAETRLKALLGNLVDFVRDPKMKKPVTVRLLHRSFSAYLNRTRWIGANLPSGLKQIFPDYFSRRLAIHCIKYADDRNAIMTFRLDDMLTKFPPNNQPTDFEQAVSISEAGQKFFDKRAPSKGLDPHFSRVLRISEPWRKWKDFLLYVVEGFFSFAMDSDPDPPVADAQLEWPELLSPAIATVHFVRCAHCKSHVRTWWHWYIILSIWRSGAMDLLINLLHDQAKSVYNHVRNHHFCAYRDGTGRRDSLLHNSRLYQDLANIMSYKEIDGTIAPSKRHFGWLLHIHVSDLTPNCMFDWDSLSPQGLDQRFIPTPEAQNCLVRFFRAQQRHISPHKIGGITSRAPVVYSRDLSHHPACPFARTPFNSLSHWLRCKKETRIVLGDDIYDNITGSILKELMRERNLCSSFQNLRQKFRALATAGAKSSRFVCESIFREAHSQLSEPIDPKNYPKCGVHSCYVLDSDVQELLRDIIEVFSHCQPLVDGTYTEDPFGLPHQFPLMRQRHPLNCCAVKTRRGKHDHKSDTMFHSDSYSPNSVQTDSRNMSSAMIPPGNKDSP